MSIQCYRKIIYIYSINFDEGLRVFVLLNNVFSSFFFIVRFEKRENLFLKIKKKIVNFCQLGYFYDFNLGVVVVWLCIDVLLFF